MLKSDKQTVKWTWLAVVFLVLAFFLRLVAKQKIFPGWCNFGVTSIYGMLLFVWGISLQQRILNQKIRSDFIATTILMAFWLTARTIKFYFAADESMERYLWYLYYIPMLLIPLKVLFISLSLGKSEYYELPKEWRWMYFPTWLLILLVLTNDLHQFVFVFPDNAKIFTDTAYTYGWGYFCILVWEAFCSSLAFGTMLLRCRIPCGKTMRMLPMLPMVLLIFYAVGYIVGFPGLRYYFGDMTSVFCILISAILECCIRNRLIPSNMGYTTLFKLSTIPALITDCSGKEEARTSHWRPVPLEQLQKSKREDCFLDRNTLLKSRALFDGTVFVQEEVKTLVDAVEQLAENNRFLERRNQIEQQNYKEQQKLFRLQESNALYDALQKHTKEKVEQICALLQKYQQSFSEAEQRICLAKIAVLGTYIKRSGNIMLLGKENRIISSAELKNAFTESCMNLELLGVEYGIAIDLSEKIEHTMALQMYQWFETIVEADMEAMRALWLNIRFSKEQMVFYISVDSGAELHYLGKIADQYTKEDGSQGFTWKIQRSDSV